MRCTVSMFWTGTDASEPHCRGGTTSTRHRSGVTIPKQKHKPSFIISEEKKKPGGESCEQTKEEELGSDWAELSTKA